MLSGKNNISTIFMAKVEVDIRVNGAHKHIHIITYGPKKNSEIYTSATGISDVILFWVIKMSGAYANGVNAMNDCMAPLAPSARLNNNGKWQKHQANIHNTTLTYIRYTLATEKKKKKKKMTTTTKWRETKKEHDEGESDIAWPGTLFFVRGSRIFYVFTFTFWWIN